MIAHRCTCINEPGDRDDLMDDVRRAGDGAPERESLNITTQEQVSTGHTAYIVTHVYNG